MKTAILSVLAGAAALTGADALAAAATADSVTRFTAEEVELFANTAGAGEAGSYEGLNPEGLVRGNGDEVAIDFERARRGFAARRQGQRAPNAIRFMPEPGDFDEQFEEAEDIVGIADDTGAAESLGFAFESEFSSERLAAFDASAADFVLFEESEPLVNPLPGAFVLMLAGLAGWGGLTLRKARKAA
ncbi:MAG: hypothetical protein ABL957_01610 [Parvularculaceae bacterium]